MIESPTTPGHAATTSAIPPAGPKRESSLRTSLADSLHYAALAIPGDTSISWSGAVGSASADVAVTRL